MKYGSFKYGQYKYGDTVRGQSTAVVLVSVEASGATNKLGSGVSDTIITPISLWRKLAIAQGETRFAVSVESLANKLAIAQNETAFILSAESLAAKLAVGWGTPTVYLSQYGQWVKYVSGEGTEIVIINPDAYGKRIIGEIVTSMQIIGHDVVLSARPTVAYIQVVEVSNDQIKVTNT